MLELTESTESTESTWRLKSQPLKVSIFGATNFCQSKGPVPSHSFASWWLVCRTPTTSQYYHYLRDLERSTVFQLLHYTALNDLYFQVLPVSACQTIQNFQSNHFGVLQQVHQSRMNHEILLVMDIDFSNDHASNPQKLAAGASHYITLAGARTSWKHFRHRPPMATKQEQAWPVDSFFTVPFTRTFGEGPPPQLIHWFSHFLPPDSTRFQQVTVCHDCHVSTWYPLCSPQSSSLMGPSGICFLARHTSWHSDTSIVQKSLWQRFSESLWTQLALSPTTRANI